MLDARFKRTKWRESDGGLVRKSVQKGNIACYECYEAESVEVNEDETSCTVLLFRQNGMLCDNYWKSLQDSMHVIV